MSNLEYQLFYNRHLPHLQPPGATIFITFRLADSLPMEVQEQLLDEARRIDSALEQILNMIERSRQADLAHRLMFGKWDTTLDTIQTGPHYLNDRRIADLVANSLHYRDGKVYDLVAYCIMPNHVHLVSKPLQKDDGSYNTLSSIMHSLKRHTARQSNIFLGREGPFWQHENYDHVIRDEAELNRVLTYVINNPVKAGLVNEWKDWEWTYCIYDM